MAHPPGPFRTLPDRRHALDGQAVNTKNEPMQVSLIGTLAVTKNGKILPLPASRKTRALLAYLLLNPGQHRRERLCEIFWQVPDDPRGSLRWSLSKLRKLLDHGDVQRIVSDRERVSLDPAGLDVDLLALRAELAGGPAALATERLEQLAVETAAGLLPGLDLSGQPEFDHFLSTEREAFRVLRRDLLIELARRFDEAPADAVRWQQMLVETEPYSLAVHRSLIESLVRAGRKADAEKQLRASMATLREVEGIDLMPLRQAAAGKAAPSPAAVPAAARRPLEQEIRFCKAADGTRIAYATVGSGPPLVKTANWLNHLDFDWESPVWRHVFHALADGRKLFRYDARGNGLSDRNIDDFSFDRQVSDLEAVIEATGLERFPLLGLSQGCAISVEFAVRYPEKVSRLILIGGYARGWNAIGNAELVRQTQAMITLVAIGWGRGNPTFRQMFTSMFMPDAPAENQSWFNELQRITTTPANACSLLRAMGDVDITERLPLVRAPTLVMHAARDLRVPFDAGRELASGIPGARFVSLDTANHLMPETDPAWPVALREINDFLAE